MTLQDVKKANPEFFNEDISASFRDSEFEILPSAEGPVLRVTSILGTRPVYSIDADTLELNYLRHDEDVMLFDEETPSDPPEDETESETDAG